MELSAHKQRRKKKTRDIPTEIEIKVTDGAKALAAYQHLRAVKQQEKAATRKPPGRR